MQTSSNLSTPGQWRSSTRRQNGSFSHCHLTGPRPAHSKPSSRPPIPEKSEPIVSNEPSVLLRTLRVRAMARHQESTRIGASLRPFCGLRRQARRCHVHARQLSRERLSLERKKPGCLARRMASEAARSPAQCGSRRLRRLNLPLRMRLPIPLRSASRGGSIATHEGP